MTEDIRSLTQIRGRLALKREGELRAALAAMTKERDDWKRRAELARATTHTLANRIVVLEKMLLEAG